MNKDPKKILRWHIVNGDNRGNLFSEDMATVINHIEELERDKQRLDWLADKNNTAARILLPRECVERNLSSLRDAIDDAMSTNDSHHNE